MKLMAMQESDVESVSDLAQRSFVAAYSKFNTPENMQRHLADNLSPTAFTNLLLNSQDRGGVYLAHDESFSVTKPVGFFELVAGDWQRSDRDAVEILRFYLDPSIIGGGFGRKLMESCVGLCTEFGFSTVWLGVWEQNSNAIGFYRRMGFEKTGEKSFVLGTDQQSDWVMERQLTES